MNNENLNVTETNTSTNETVEIGEKDAKEKKPNFFKKLLNRESKKIRDNY